MKMVEMVLKRLCEIVTINKRQFGFMHENAMLILRRLQQEHCAKGKRLHICFLEPEKAFDRVSRTVLEWTMVKKGIPEALARSVMSRHKGAKTRVTVDYELSGV